MTEPSRFDIEFDDAARSEAEWMQHVDDAIDDDSWLDEFDLAS